MVEPISFLHLPFDIRHIIFRRLLPDERVVGDPTSTQALVNMAVSCWTLYHDIAEISKEWSPKHIFTWLSVPKYDMICQPKHVLAQTKVEILEWSFFYHMQVNEQITNDSGPHRKYVVTDTKPEAFLRHLDTGYDNFEELYTRHRATVKCINFDFTPAPDYMRSSCGIHRTWQALWLNERGIEGRFLQRWEWDLVARVNKVGRYVSNDTVLQITGSYGVRCDTFLDRLMLKCARRRVLLVFAGEYVQLAQTVTYGAGEIIRDMKHWRQCSMHREQTDSP